MDVGCGAGQITQTDSQVAAVDGTYGNVGNSIALRNVLIPYPPNQTGTYPIGAAVPVLFTIINQDDSADELVGVDSPAASQVVVEGTTQIPPGTTVTSTTGSAPISIQPTSPLIVGQLRMCDGEIVKPDCLIRTEQGWIRAGGHARLRQLRHG